mmetsp:Transcript_8016/g.23815  ORF Transcript_8016/g.23815 Transcript_8016/m.23815 type:complete len:122 (-) Transcript_8016:701-1066(-)
MPGFFLGAWPVIVTPNPPLRAAHLRHLKDDLPETFYKGRQQMSAKDVFAQSLTSFQAHMETIKTNYKRNMTAARTKTPTENFGAIVIAGLFQIMATFEDSGLVTVYDDILQCHKEQEQACL